MRRDTATEYAQRWADAWNRLDLDAVLEHFDDDVAFTSPKALEAVGTPTVRGKAALHHYWSTALRPLQSLRFDIVRIVWDPESAELAIIYDRQVNGRRDRGTEVLHFGPDDTVVRGEAMYGVIP